MTKAKKRVVCISKVVYPIGGEVYRMLQLTPPDPGDYPISVDEAKGVIVHFGVICEGKQKRKIEAKREEISGANGSEWRCGVMMCYEIQRNPPDVAVNLRRRGRVRSPN